MKKIIFSLCFTLLLTSCWTKDTCLDKGGSYNETTKQCEFSEKIENKTEKNMEQKQKNTSTENTLFGSWELEKIEEKGKEVSIKRKKDFVLTLDAEGFSSSTDCNTLMWKITTDNEQMSFGNIAWTMMACEDSQEDIYAEYLKNVESFSQHNTDLILITKDGVILIFKKKDSEKIEQKPVDEKGNKTNEKMQKEVKKVEVKEDENTKISNNSSEIINVKSDDCPSLVSGFKGLDRALLIPIAGLSEGDLFQALCQNEAEKQITEKLWRAENSLYSMLWYNSKTKKIIRLPVFSDHTSLFTDKGNKQYILSDTYEAFVIGISPESTEKNSFLDIVYLWDKIDNGIVEPKKVWKIDAERYEAYSEWIIYKKWRTDDLRFFDFETKQDSLIAKNVAEFVLLYNNNPQSKVFKDGWNALYYQTPKGVWKNITSDEEEKNFTSKKLDIKFYRFYNKKSQEALTLPSKTKILSGMCSYVWLADTLTKMDGEDPELGSITKIFFGDKRIK